MRRRAKTWAEYDEAGQFLRWLRERAREAQRDGQATEAQAMAVAHTTLYRLLFAPDAPREPVPDDGARRQKP